MAKENFSMPMRMFLKASGTWTKPMDMVPINIRMVPNMKVTGRMTFNMVKVSRPGQIIPNLKVTTLSVKNMAKVHTITMTALNIMVIGETTISPAGYFSFNFPT